MQTNLLLLDVSKKVFISHSFCESPLYTLETATHKYTLKERALFMEFKVARTAIFVGTPSTFKSLIRNQIGLYCKAIITGLLHIY